MNRLVLSIAAAAAFAAAAFADDPPGFLNFGHVCADKIHDNLILDLGNRPLEAGCSLELRRTKVTISGKPARTNMIQFAPIPGSEKVNPVIATFPVGYGDIYNAAGTFSLHLSDPERIDLDSTNCVHEGDYCFVVAYDAETNCFKLSTNFCVESSLAGNNYFPKFAPRWARISDQDGENPTNIVFISDADADGDGLSDEFENTINTDPNNSDTDGDGFSDGFEYAHYMDPLSKYELDFRLTVDFFDENPEESGTKLPLYDLSWNSGVDLPYTLEFAPRIPSGEQATVWTNILVTNASDTLTIYNINHIIESTHGPDAGFFRLWYLDSDTHTNLTFP